MTVFFHELKRNKLSLIIWSCAISFMLGVCVLIYPEMSSQMGEISEMFADMGNFSSAFGLDQLNFGEFMGYFGVECGNVLGLGGAFFAAITGISALAKEEKEHTAEFLLTHPISRKQIIAEKLAAVITQIILLNLVTAIVVTGTVLIIGEQASAGTIALLLLAYLLLQLELAAVTFGISAFLKGNGLGIGLGLAVMLYFFNLLANLTEDAKFLKYITPFGYTEGSYIINNNAIDISYLLPGILFTGLGIIAAFVKYNRKDIV